MELGKVDEWLDGQDILDGTPFLIAPDGVYDVVLNSFFLSFRLVAASRHTQEAVARDLARFLDFLWFHRPCVGDRKRSWRDATTDDRRVFEFWRCRDENGPLVAASTWDREVSSVNGFYRWAVRSGHLTASPMVQRPSRSRPKRSRWSEEPETSAERRPDVCRDRVA
jgi:site-specific recombinase XerC